MEFCHSDTLLVAEYPGEARTWNVGSGTVVCTIKIDGVFKAVGSPHHSLVPAPGLVYDAASGHRLRQWALGEAAVFKPDGASFISGGLDGGLTTWNIGPLLVKQEQTPILAGLPGEEPELEGTFLQGPQVRPESKPSQFGR